MKAVHAESDGPFMVLERDRFPWAALSRLAFVKTWWMVFATSVTAVPVAAVVAIVTGTNSYVLGEWLGIAAVLNLIALGGIRLAPRLLARHRRAIDDPRDWSGWCAAAEARDIIVSSWPQLRRHVEVGADAEAVVNRALWDLAGTIRERARIRDAQHELRMAYKELRSDDPVAVALSARMRALGVARERVDAEVNRRIAHLTGLAASGVRFLDEQAAIAHARDAARTADELLGETGLIDAGDDAGRDLAERTDAILNAYRELQRTVT
jgi:hypothetical protein